MSQCPICGKGIPREFCLGCGLIPACPGAGLVPAWTASEWTPALASEPREYLVSERL